LNSAVESVEVRKGEREGKGRQARSKEGSEEESNNG
jgi:hypothetical protein